jgi:hypothetical protein
MKSPWWIGIGLAALFAFGATTVLADKECEKNKDVEESELLADCGKCDKDKGDDEEEAEEAELLADCGKCDKDKGDDEEEEATEGEVYSNPQLADCGKCDKDKGDDEEEAEGELLADCGKCDKDKGDDEEETEEAELSVA